MSTRKIGFFVVVSVLVFVLGACAPAPQDASKAISRGVIQSGGIVPAEKLRVAEYLQYYPQNFPAPVNTTLALDLRLGNPQVPVQGGTAWLQIGIPARSAAAEEIAPLNLALVIDRSGSMDVPDKMPYLKQSLAVFLRSLAPNDIVSLIAYNENAELIAPAAKVGNGSWIDSAVARLQPSGYTNLYGGMMLGFSEVDRNFDVRRNNRVILLTDGIANVGTTDPDQIAAAARKYNDKGIYLSTIGLGQDFNDALLSRLAIQGKGGYHFIDSAEEMDKVFRKEVIGLLQKAASSVSILISPEGGVTVEALTGYDGRPPAGTIRVRMQDMSTGDSQVLLARLTIPLGPSGRRPLATVELDYHDLISDRDQVITASVAADASRMNNYDPAWDVEVLRNITIQRSAEGLKEIDRLYQAQRYQEAWDIAYRLEQDLRTVARLTGEAQMIKDADLMRTYQGTLSKWVEYQTGHPPRPVEGTWSDQPFRGREPLPTPSEPALDIR